MSYRVYDPFRLAGISRKSMTDPEVCLWALGETFNPETVTVSKERLPFSAVSIHVNRGKKRDKYKAQLKRKDGA